MYKILQKIDRIRAAGQAILKLEPNSTYFHLNGKCFKVKKIGPADYNCLVTVLIQDKAVDFSIKEIL